MRKTTKVLLILFFFIVFVIFGWAYLFKPFKIKGGKAGPYNEGQTVLSHYKVGSLEPHDVIIFKSSSGVGDNVGYVVGNPGDQVGEAYYRGSNKKLEGGIVPSDTIAIKMDEGKYTWIISENKVTHVVWYPFR